MIVLAMEDTFKVSSIAVLEYLLMLLSNIFNLFETLWTVFYGIDIYTLTSWESPHEWKSDVLY